MTRYLQLAELRIDPARRAEYLGALRHQVDAALATEPGVLALVAASVPDAPGEIRVFEVYADREAYLSHLQAPHFLAYKAAVADIVQSLRLIPLDPIHDGARW